MLERVHGLTPDTATSSVVCTLYCLLVFVNYFELLFVHYTELVFVLTLNLYLCTTLNFCLRTTLNLYLCSTLNLLSCAPLQILYLHKTLRHLQLVFIYLLVLVSVYSFIIHLSNYKLFKKSSFEGKLHYRILCPQLLIYSSYIYNKEQLDLMNLQFSLF